MASWQPLQFVGGAYTDDATPWTSQDRVNYIPVSAEKAGTRSPQMLRQAPGCRLFTADGVASPVRGLHSAEGLLIAVKGQTLYSYDSEGAATSLGTIPGVKRCSIAHNQITSGNQIAIANGSSGYVYNTVTGVLAQITDEGFPGAKVFDFVDQYIVGVEPAGRYWFHSDLSAATDYNTLDRYEAETAPDKIVTLIATHGEVFVLGERTSEFFYNTGQATGTFQRRDAGMEIGCAAAHSVVRLDNSVVWLGHDGSVYRLNGYQPQRISTHAIEQAIARCNVADAYAFTFEDRGHKVYYLTFTDGQTFGFDMATGLWHRRKSYGLDFWRMSHLVRWGRTWVGGDYTNGSIYRLDWRRNDDAGEPLERINTLAPIHDNGNRLIVNAIKIEIDAGKTSESFPPAYEPPAPSITGDVPDGMVGDEVDYSYTVTGGVNPVSVSVGSGTPPPGLTFNSDGTVEGTYTAAGSYSWVMLATDAVGNTATVADTAEVQALDAPLYVAVDNALTLLESTDGGASFPATVATGLVTATSEVCVMADGGRLFHLGNLTEGRVSTDAVNFSACTGLPTNPGAGNLLKVGSEWQLYIGTSTLYLSTDGVAFSTRAITAGTGNTVSRPVKKDESTVLARASGNRFNITADGGVTWAVYQVAAFNSSEGIQRLLYIPGGDFIAFGNNGSTQLLIGRSATGLSGSWSTGAGPATALCHGVERDPDTGRVVMVLQTGATWYSDDDCVSWSAGAAVPYAGASAYPPGQTNNMIFSDGYFYFTASQGGGINRIYRSPDGVTAWAQVYTSSSGNSINSMCEFTP